VWKREHRLKSIDWLTLDFSKELQSRGVGMEINRVAMADCMKKKRCSLIMSAALVSELGCQLSDTIAVTTSKCYFKRLQKVQKSGMGHYKHVGDFRYELQDPDEVVLFTTTGRNVWMTSLMWAGSAGVVPVSIQQENKLLFSHSFAHAVALFTSLFKHGSFTDVLLHMGALLLSMLYGR
jgi:hypothetical protein